MENISPIYVASASPQLQQNLWDWTPHIHDQESSPTYVGAIINDCKVMLQTMPQCSLIFVRRSTNCAAHSLARALILFMISSFGVIFPTFSSLAVKS